MTYKGIIGRKYEQHLITERCQTWQGRIDRCIWSPPSGKDIFS